MINFPTLCIDNFYNDPDKVREFALTQEYEISPGNYPGKRTKPLYVLNPELFQSFCLKFFSIYYPLNQVEWNISTSFWKVGTLDSNPFSPKNMGWIHEDGCLVAGVVYLSPGFPKKLGTTIYRRTKEKKPINGLAMKKFYSTGEDDGFDEAIIESNSCYEETAQFDNVYNRLVCFDGNVSHSPTHYYMEDDIRLNQVFFIHNIKSELDTPLQRVRNFLV